MWGVDVSALKLTSEVHKTVGKWVCILRMQVFISPPDFVTFTLRVERAASPVGDYNDNTATCNRTSEMKDGCSQTGSSHIPVSGQCSSGNPTATPMFFWSGILMILLQILPYATGSQLFLLSITSHFCISGISLHHAWYSTL
jgi:hypothetical protein